MLNDLKKPSLLLLKTFRSKVLGRGVHVIKHVHYCFFHNVCSSGSQMVSFILINLV